MIFSIIKLFEYSKFTSLPLLTIIVKQLGPSLFPFLKDLNSESGFKLDLANSNFEIGSPILLQDAVQAQRRLTAAEQIEREEKNKQTDSRQKSPLLEQVEELIPTLIDKKNNDFSPENIEHVSELLGSWQDRSRQLLVQWPAVLVTVN